MSLPLLSTKFNTPSTGVKLVHRPRLLRMLDENLEQNASLILVCGPAGYGKTTLVSEWLQTSQKIHPDQFAWLTLERGDNDLTRFLAYFVTSLQRIRPGFAGGVLKMLQTHKPSPLPVLATLLINEISQFPEPFFLVLDDYHLITSESIQSFIAFLVDHQPPQMHLVLITRSDPPLPLARLRARGQLVELRQEELCFQLEEVEEFTNLTMSLALPPEQVTFLAKQTEGWISGLQLAAISVREAQDRSAFFRAFSGEHKFIADYLTDDVLAGLSEPVRTFLLQTSILERLSAQLCEAVTGQAGAQATLEQLMDDNLFIVPLDDRQIWYRYHTLFADLVRKRLQEVLGEQVYELHIRASQWFEANNLADLAIEHAIAGEDYDRAAGLIVQSAENMLMHGQAVTLTRWLETLPRETILAHQSLGTLYTFTLMLRGRPPNEAATVFHELVTAGSLDEYQGEATMLRALLAVLQGKSAEAIQLSEQALRQLPEERAFFRSLAADSLGMAHTLAGDIEAATRAFEQVVDISMQSDNVMMALMALTNLAGLQYVQGQLRLAIASCRQVIDLADQRIGRQTPIIGKTLLNLGEMLREQGDLDAALSYLLESATMLEIFSEVGLPLTSLGIARIFMNKRDWLEAQSYIDRARQQAQASRSTLMDDRLVDVLQVRYWIARGDLELADHWAQGRGILDRSPAEVFSEAARTATLNELLHAEYLALVRLTLAQQHPDRALEILAYLHDLVEKRGYKRRVIEILALEALALHQRGDLDQALHAVGKALALAEPEGYQRTFIDEGEPMARLLYQAAAHEISPIFAGRLLEVLYEENQSTRPYEEPPNKGLIEPLSQRELEVLQLIAEGLTNAEIARRLYISLSTVKGHTANIFGKLGVKNRTQSIARGRSLGLLPTI